MWVKRREYMELYANCKAQSQTIELLRIRVNELTMENAQLKAEKFGIVPNAVPQLERADPASAPKNRRVPEAPSLADLFTGANLNMEDMGDKEAARLGISHDEQGFVQYQ